MRIFIIYIFGLLIQISTQIGFPKDLDATTVHFPPILERRDGIPTGHLRPLGWQSRATSSVHEETVHLNAKHFWKQYVKKAKPIYIRGLVFGSDAIDNWNDAYLSRSFSHIDINVINRKQRIVENLEKMKMKKFLQGYRSEDWYLNVIMPYEMQIEAPIPYIINCGSFVNGLSESLNKTLQLIENYLWMSAGDTSSLLHSHSDHNLHCVLDGRKDFILIPSEQFSSKYKNDWKKMLNIHETYPNSGDFVSHIDPDMVNVYEYKILNGINWFWSTLRAGDCIYIPSDYLHQVRSYGRSISSSIYFTQIQQLNDKLENNFDFDSCMQNAPLFNQISSTSENFLFTYTHGDRHLTQRNMKPHHAKYFLLYLLGVKQKLYFEKFNHFFQDLTVELKEIDGTDLQLDSLAVWYGLDGGKQMYLTKADIYKLTDESLKGFLNVLNRAASFHDNDRNAQHEL